MRIAMRDGREGVDEAFLALPHALYAGDPCWIPEEEGPVRRAFSDANDWFAGGRAATFCIPDRARLAVFRRDDCVVEGRPAAFFGYMESDDDGSALHELLEHGRRWATDAGAEMLYGPIDFDTFGRYRLRTSAERAGATPFPSEPYNRPAYPALLEHAGFAVARRYVSQLSIGALAADEAKRDAANALSDEGFTTHPLDGATWLALLPELHRRVHEIFAEGFAYTPVSYERFAATQGAGVARRLCPHTSTLARDPNGELAGFLLVFPHYGPLVVQGAGAGRVPASALAYDQHPSLLAAAGHHTAIVKTVGVAPAYRRRGVMDAMVVSTLDRGRDRYDRWIGALIRDDNPSGRYGAARERMERHYALYAAALRDETCTIVHV
jgi:Acetyltransferase (GNAT) family.